MFHNDKLRYYDKKYTTNNNIIFILRTTILGSSIVSIYTYYIYSLNLFTPTIIIVLAYPALLIATGRTNSLNFSLHIAFIYLFYYPIIGFYLEGEPQYGIYMSIVIAVYALTQKIHTDLLPGRFSAIRLKDLQYKDVDIFVFIILAAFGSLGLFFYGENDIFRPLVFQIPVALLFLYLEKISITSNVKVSYALLFIIYTVIIVYIVYFWSGFGRIVVGSYFLIPLLIISSRRDIGLRLWQPFVAGPFLLALLQNMRSGSAEVISLNPTSSAHHLILTDFIGNSSIVIGAAGWPEFARQWILGFLNWFPRFLWSDKPIGVGSEFVDSVIGRSGFSEGYSVSVGFMGEQLYYLGGFAWVGILISVATLLVVRKILVKISSGYRSVVITYDVMLISYIWGGLATFGSRVWFFILPMLVFIYIWKYRIGRAM